MANGNRHSRFAENRVENFSRSDENNDDSNSESNRNNHTRRSTTPSNRRNRHGIHELSKSSEYGQTLSQLMAIKHYSIVVGIQVSNKTEYFLTEPIAKHYSGYILIPPGRIEPKHKEFMIAHKHGYTMTGSSGIVSWLIQNTEKRLVIRWTAPFFTSNTLSIGLTTAGHDGHNDKWFDAISTSEKKGTSNGLTYKSRSYGEEIDEIMTNDDEFTLFGSMGTSNKPEVRITLCPNT